eukprot:XP_001694464.1 predicted protein [Chlamydomonas reinhardtii]
MRRAGGSPFESLHRAVRGAESRQLADVAELSAGLLTVPSSSGSDEGRIGATPPRSAGRSRAPREGSTRRAYDGGGSEDDLDWGSTILGLNDGLSSILSGSEATAALEAAARAMRHNSRRDAPRRPELLGVRDRVTAARRAGDVGRREQWPDDGSSVTTASTSVTFTTNMTAATPRRGNATVAGSSISRLTPERLRAVTAAADNAAAAAGSASAQKMSGWERLALAAARMADGNGGGGGARGTSNAASAPTAARRTPDAGRSGARAGGSRRKETSTDSSSSSGFEDLGTGTRDLPGRIERTKQALARLQLGSRLLQGPEVDRPPNNTAERRRLEARRHSRREAVAHEMRLMRKELGLGAPAPAAPAAAAAAARATSGEDSDDPSYIVRQRLAPAKRVRLLRSLRALHTERPELLQSRGYMRRLRRLLRWLAGEDGATGGRRGAEIAATEQRLFRAVTSGIGGSAAGTRRSRSASRHTPRQEALQAVLGSVAKPSPAAHKVEVEEAQQEARVLRQALRATRQELDRAERERLSLAQELRAERTAASAVAAAGSPRGAPASPRGDAQAVSAVARARDPVPTQAMHIADAAVHELAARVAQLEAANSKPSQVALGAALAAGDSSAIADIKAQLAALEQRLRAATQEEGLGQPVPGSPAAALLVGSAAVGGGGAAGLYPDSYPRQPPIAAGDGGWLPSSASAADGIHRPEPALLGSSPFHGAGGPAVGQRSGASSRSPSAAASRSASAILRRAPSPSGAASLSGTASPRAAPAQQTLPVAMRAGSVAAAQASPPASCTGSRAASVRAASASTRSPARSAAAVGGAIGRPVSPLRTSSRLGIASAAPTAAAAGPGAVAPSPVRLSRQSKSTPLGGDPARSTGPSRALSTSSQAAPGGPRTRAPSASGPASRPRSGAHTPRQQAASAAVQEPHWSPHISSTEDEVEDVHSGAWGAAAQAAHPARPASAAARANLEDEEVGEAFELPLYSEGSFSAAGGGNAAADASAVELRGGSRSWAGRGCLRTAAFSLSRHVCSLTPRSRAQHVVDLSRELGARLGAQAAALAVAAGQDEPTPRLQSYAQAQQQQRTPSQRSMAAGGGSQRSLRQESGGAAAEAEAARRRCLELESQLEAQAAEMQRLLAAAKANAEAGERRAHSSAAEVQLAARCRQLEGQLQQVHGEMEELLSRTAGMREVVSDGAAGLRAHLQQLEERLGGLEAENGRLRREAELQGREAAASAAERAAALAGRINALQDAVEGLSQDKQELQLQLELAQMAPTAAAAASRTAARERQQLQNRIEEVYRCSYTRCIPDFTAFSVCYNAVLLLVLPAGSDVGGAGAGGHERQVKALSAENDDLRIQAGAGSSRTSQAARAQSLSRQLDAERRLRSHLNDLQARAVRGRAVEYEVEVEVEAQPWARVLVPLAEAAEAAALSPCGPLCLRLRAAAVAAGKNRGRRTS